LILWRFSVLKNEVNAPDAPIATRRWLFAATKGTGERQELRITLYALPIALRSANFVAG
jgi:hypothetical protein